MLGLLFFAELVVQPGRLLYSDYSDMLSLHLPAKRFEVRSWQQTGEVPLWCPYNFGGMPFVHDLQSSAFYPPHLPLLLLPEEHIGAALSWLIVLHVIVAGWCMFAYARWRGLGTAGALVAACGYMFAGKWLLHVLAGGHYNMVPLAWLPLVLLWLEQAICRGSLLRATWAGMAFALIVLGAYPYVTLYAGLFVALWALGTVLDEGGYLGRREHSCLRLAAALGRWAALGAWTAMVAVDLGAVQLLPGLEAAGQASRSLGVAASEATLAEGLRSLIGLVGPPLTADPNWVWENRVGLGLLWLGTAALAVVLCGRRAWFEAAVCLVLIGFALGGAAALQALPGFRLFQLPSRALLLLAFPVALLVGRATQALFTPGGVPTDVRLRSRRALLKVTGAVLVLLGVHAVVSRLRGEQLPFHFYWLAVVPLVLAAWWLLGRPERSWPRWVWAWGLVLLADLWAVGWPLVAVRSEADIYALSPCVSYLADHRHEHGRVLDIQPAGQSANATPLWPGLPTVAGIEPVRGFNPIDVLRYKEYLQFLTDQDAPLHPLDRMFTSAVLGTFPIKNQSLADLLGVRYLVQPADMPLDATVPDAAARKSWQKVAEDSKARTFNFIASTPSGDDCGLRPLPPYQVYENRNALPRAFVVPQAAPLPERAAALAALKGTHFRRTVLLEDFEPVGPAKSAAGQFRAAAIEEYLPNRVIVRTQTDAPGYLVLTDVWFPGWTCSVDGRETRLYRADFLFRAVTVPAGSHEVVFTFTPASYRWGKCISLVGLATILGLSLGTLARSRALRSDSVQSRQDVRLHAAARALHPQRC